MTILIVIGIGACNSGGSDATKTGVGTSGTTSTSGTTETAATTVTGTGTFYGSIIQGVQYYNNATGSLSASNPFTDSRGTFNYTYVTGTSTAATSLQLTFHVGNIILGTATIPAAKTADITAYNLVKDTVDSNQQAVNIMRFLKTKSVNSSIDPNVISISEAVRTSLSQSQVTSLNIASTTTSNNTFETELTKRLTTLPGYSANDVPVANDTDITNNLSNTSAIVEASQLGSLSLTAGGTSLPADGKSNMVLTATVTNASNATMEGVPVRFSTTAGTLSSSIAQTNAKGKALITLTAPVKSGKATVTASFGGSNQLFDVTFNPGSVSTAQSSLTANPTTLAADGVATTTVTVILNDSNNNQVADGTKVSLNINAGSVTSSNPAVTKDGRVTFTVLSPTAAASGIFTLQDYPAMTTKVTFGTFSATGEPASIQFNNSNSNISVAGVGATENTSININVLDDTGNQFKESVYKNNFNTLDNNSNNNLKITLVSFPNRGEFISAKDAKDSTVSTQNATNSIWIRTTNGSAILNLKSGTLPGIMEIKAEVIKSDGITLGATALAPKVTISSGPPHTIVLSTPELNSIADLGGGVYCRTGTALVTDRWGNTVPNGTAISLGLIDSVIAEGTDGKTTANSKDLTSGQNFASLSITRNNYNRKIEQEDRILIQNAAPSDKNRFVNAINGATINAQSSFKNTASELHYFIGASTLGASIGGGESCSKLTTGTMTTTDGKATIWVRYPAHNNNFGNNQGTILVGCLGYDVKDLYKGDDRYGNQNSPQVIVVAASNDSGATTMSKGQFCFSAIRPLALGILVGNGVAIVTVKDKGGITLPNMSVLCSQTAGNVKLNFNNTIATTNKNGDATFTYNVVAGTDKPSCPSTTTTTTPVGTSATTSVPICTDPTPATIKCTSDDASIEINTRS
ncbi:MAG: Ig-like domain-containing protein [Magnetococcus sp. YQC-5]